MVNEKRKIVLSYYTSNKGFFESDELKSYFCFSFKDDLCLNYNYLPTPPLGQDMTQGQFLSGV